MQAMEFYILDLIQKMRHPLMDRLMVLLSVIGNHGEVWIVVGVLLFAFCYRGTKKTKKYTQMYLVGVEENQHAAGHGRTKECNVGITVLLALMVSAIVVNMGLKPYIARIRPYDVKTTVEIITGAMPDFSFPSGHTSSSFAAATVIALWNRKVGLAALMLAAVISFSRLYLYLHYPTDVIAGVLIGILCGLIARFMHSYVVEKL